MAFEDALVSRVGSSLPLGAVVPGGEKGFVLVDGEGPSSQGGSIQDTRSGSTPVLGRVSVKMGHAPPRSSSVCCVVGAGEVAAHQSSRNEGIVSGIAVISGVGCQSSCDRDVRQLDSGGLRQQAGRDSLPLPLLVGQPSSEVVGESQRPPRCEVSTRAVQCSGRSPQPSGSGYRNRVVSPPAGGESSASSLGLAVDQFVRDEPQREASPILFPCPESPGGLRGCVLSSLGQPGPVRVPTLSSGRKGGDSVRDTQSLHDSGRPPLAREGVVRRPSTNPTTCGSSVVGPVVATAPLQQVPQRRPPADPSRVATLHRLLRKLAFRVALWLRCQAASEHPLPGCTRRSGCSSVVDVVEGTLLQSMPLYPRSWNYFLVHLRRDKGFSVSAVRAVVLPLIRSLL